ncbi:2-amino-4-hydroxy-6-hydroxymethyldihydropteridine diphosphokinase [Endozoicomonas sp. 8E]|uniref:2-amino-4-hydroxy-6- hydroxymethyldihydropteridine diphosphokinase n=1 Tax=Endozoicomonas sp. 8E TaxID=3035692 RepID=UPI002938DC06|nr:2-amino-4-hydroxy-6-hydroxymethyldihydropteridine diphosphokinase [Endozoicomonas sp. 8E]WOG27585.1 2-amino-4-hydroxy-6-hydroxymethyldihydropteridine diphosphokinase [Endozoicomonas sp. 8E]
MTTVYIALGSNLENPGLQLQRAVDDIDSLPEVELSGCSKLYISEPVGPEGQPDYCNAAVRIETTLEPLALLDAMQAIENDHGRVRTVHWGPRTLDLDIILYGDDIIESKRLTVPHYQMHVRNFVLCPLLDIAPDLTLPDGRKAAALLAEVGTAGIEVVATKYPWL